MTEGGAEQLEQTISIKPPTPHGRKQELIMRAFLYPDVKEVFVACGSKFGKSEYYRTVTPTPDRGYVELKDVKAGDFVFDEHGKPTRVVYATDLMYDHVCYELTFSDGNKVIADADHDWVTTTHAERKNIARALSPNDRCKSTTAKPCKRTTKEIFDTQHHIHHGIPRPNHAIPTVTAPLEFNKKALPIPPYTLGVWLGDGDSGAGLFSKPDIEVADYVALDGFAALLKKHGLYNNKHVPTDYLISSVDDRAALLQGLMDTDGTISSRGDCCFDNTNKNIADAVATLAMGLGIKVNRSERVGRLNGVDKKLCYRVWFTTDFPVFRLKRKKDRLRPITLKSRQRTIVSVERVESVPVMCIQVENPTHLFLTTDACIPTHNSLGAATCLTNAAMQKRGAKWRWLAPVFRQASVGLDYFKGLVPPPPHSEFLDSKMLIKFPYLGSQIEFMHTSNPVDLEGPGIAGQVGDEAAKMHFDAYVSAKTTTTRTHGPSMWVSTPYGKNWFYKKYMEAKDEMAWAIKNGKPVTKIAIHAPTSANPFVTKEVLEQARRDMPDRLFRQYYMAEFLDDGSIFVGVRECVRGPEIQRDGHAQHWFVGDIMHRDVVIGVDWAKRRDYTVFMAIDHTVTPRKVVGFMRFHGLSYVAAVKELYLFARKFKTVGTIWHDKTGVGEALDDLLGGFPLPFHGFTFSNSSKASIVNTLGMTFEKKDIELPNWPLMLSELDLYELTVSETGTMRYNAAAGGHDDIVMALALANAAAQEYMGDFEIRFAEDLPGDKKLETIDRYYSDLISDADDSPFN